MPLPDDHQLTPLELASGYIFGIDESAPPLPRETRDPRTVLDEIVRGALTRPPCRVAFSGGRDSSAILALATAIARREGLPLPIPVSSRFPDAPETAESEWQERLVESMGLKDWIRLELTDELDYVGPIATAVLKRHGVLWPANAHFVAAHLADDADGTLLTGNGGDQLFDRSPLARHADVARGRAWPGARDIRRLAYVAAPAPLRRAVVRRRPTAFDRPWLRPEAVRRLRSSRNADIASEPIRPVARVRWIWRLRALQIGIRSIDLSVGDAGRVVHPFLEPAFVASYARFVRRRPTAERGAAMQALFGDLVPPEVYARRTKASFEGAFWSRHSREFAERFSGRGIDDELIDLDALRRFWSGDSKLPKSRSATLLQAAWLAEHGDETVQPVAARSASSAGSRESQLFGRSNS